MVMTKRRYRVIAGAMALLALLIFCGTPFQQAANAVAIVDDALIAILIAGLAAVGITFVSTGAYSSLTEYVGSLLDQYASTIGTTSGGLFSGVQSGANSIGQLLINNRFVRLISAFGAWLKAKFSLADNQDTVVQSANNVSGVIVTPVPYAYKIATPITFQWYYTASNSPVYLVFYKYSTSLGSFISTLAYCSEPFVLHRDVLRVSTGEHTYNDYTGELNVNYYFATGGSCSYNDWIGQGVTAPLDRLYEYNGNGAETSAHLKEILDGVSVDGSEISITTGGISLPLDAPDYNDGDGAVIDVGAPWGMTYPDIVSQWLPREWAPGMSGNPSITYDDAPAIDEQVQTGPETIQVNSNPADYASPGLSSVFPFCIPFDLYEFFECLAADPEAPEISWRFYVPGICDEQIEIDLSQFDTVAQIVRTMELLAFIVGLALVTREKFLRG